MTCKKIFFLIAFFIFSYGKTSMSAANTKPELILFSGKTKGSGTIDGPAKIASFHNPQGIAVDQYGNIFVADTGDRNTDINSTIRKITPSGMVSTFAGTAGAWGDKDGKGAVANFSDPRNIVIDSHGNLFVADFHNNLIRKITPDGVVSTFVGNGNFGLKDGVGTKAELFYPNHLAIDSQNNIYLSQKTYVRKITPEGAVSTLAGVNDDTVFKSVDGKADARFTSINGLAVDAHGNVYVSEWYKIRRISQDGTVVTIAGDARGELKDGKGKDAVFNNAGSITIDKLGNIYVFEEENAIRKVTPDGVVTTIAGNIDQSESDDDKKEIPNVDGKGNQARFGGQGLALSTGPDGNIYIADAKYNSIRKMTPDGTVTTITGGARYGIHYNGEKGAGYMDKTSIACDKSETIYIANRKTIYKINSSGSTFSHDQDFEYLSSIILDTKENIYVTDAPLGLSTNAGRGGSEYSPIPKSVDNFFNSMFPKRSHYLLYKILPNGKKIKITGKPENISNIAFGHDNQLYANNFKSVFKLTPKKILSPSMKLIAGSENSHADLSVDGVGKDAKFKIILSMAVDQSNHIFVLDANRIKKITPDGVVTTIAGSDKSESIDGIGLKAELDNPRDLKIDSQGNLYFVESKNHIVRRMTPAGVVSSFVGQRGVSGFAAGDLPGVLSKPVSISICGSSLYILMKDGAVAVVRNIN